MLRVDGYSRCGRRYIDAYNHNPLRKMWGGWFGLELEAGLFFVFFWGRIALYCSYISWFYTQVFVVMLSNVFPDSVFGLCLLYPYVQSIQYWKMNFLVLSLSLRYIPYNKRS